MATCAAIRGSSLPTSPSKVTRRAVLFNYVASQLAERGLAYLHLVEGDTSGNPVPPFDYRALKRLFGGLVIANNE